MMIEELGITALEPCLIPNGYTFVVRKKGIANIIMGGPD